MKNLVLVLGAQNDDQGHLSNVALDRLNCAFDFYRFNDEVKIICTGGFGKGFNTTEKPHASYSQSFLIDKGIPENDFLPHILSAHTVEDFKISKEMLPPLNPSLLIIITSDFHMERVKILHKAIVNFSSVIFVPAKSSLTETELAPLIEHEEKAMQELKRNNYRIY